ncbi:GD11842, partial [Drosophila simulans]
AKEDICYGIMVAKDLPRFRAKVEGSAFIIKIPDHGVFRFNTFGLAASFLSRHVAKDHKLREFLPAEWKFHALEQLNKQVPSRSQQSLAAIVIED